MNHFKMSLIKSLLRIASCVTAVVLGILQLFVPAIIVIGSGLAVAEVLGILEEVFDKRKE